MSAISEPECVWALGAELGEGPVWSAHERALWFVDIKAPRIHRWSEADGSTRSYEAPAQVGFVAPLDDGGWVAGLQSGLHRFDPGSGAFTPLPRFGPDRPENRLNDGAVDARGRLWFGTMDDAEAAATGALWRLDAEGPAQAQDDGYVITNGPAFSPDGRVLYHVDTLERLIYAFDMADDGTLGARRTFARVAQGHPDGLAVDAAGVLWVALFGGGGVERFSPTGESLGITRLPVPNVTKVAFGGDDLRTVYATTARWMMDDAARAAHPLAGGLFRFRSDTAGLPQPRARLG